MPIVEAPAAYAVSAPALWLMTMTASAASTGGAQFTNRIEDIAYAARPAAWGIAGPSSAGGVVGPGPLERSLELPRARHHLAEDPPLCIHVEGLERWVLGHERDLAARAAEPLHGCFVLGGGREVRHDHIAAPEGGLA